jgi:1-acyl-sn-glycerol-3-phosphate acyltransferase
MRFRHPVNLTIFLLLKALCRVDSSELASVPRTGPLIIATNHVSFLEVPILYTFLLPRRLVGLTKTETFDNRFFGYLANLWKAIPLRRDVVDSHAFKASLEVLKDGAILAVAPEGTRSHDGVLQMGHAGVITIAALSGAPILPVAHFGGERFWHNMKRIRRTRVAIRVGETIRVSRDRVRTRTGREEVLRTTMQALAALMPEKYSGYYAANRIDNTD